jgi:BlaI family penicillinase repressor
MQISQAESIVMQELWQRQEASAEALVEALGPSQAWHESTIKTLLSRLLKKGAIEAERDGKRFVYRPLLKQDAWRLEESRGLLDRLFGGKLAPLVAHFGEQGELTDEDIAELRKVIQEIGRER